MTTLLLLVLAAFGAEPTIDELLNATDDIARGESSHGIMVMEVKTERYERSMTMEVWSKGTEKSLVKILEPAKDKGMATLKVEDNIWNYAPKVDRTIKLPAAMMSGSWMGSHFTNDDLVRENRLAEEFTATIAQKPEQNPEKVYVIELVPKPDAAIVWGKIVVKVTPEKMPREVAYFDEKGALVRTMRFGEPVDMGGRRFPATMEVVPADAPTEYTRVSYKDMQFDLTLDDALFSLQALK